MKNLYDIINFLWEFCINKIGPIFVCHYKTIEHRHRERAPLGAADHKENILSLLIALHLFPGSVFSLSLSQAPANQLTPQDKILDKDNSTHVQRTCSPGCCRKCLFNTFQVQVTITSSLLLYNSSFKDSRCFTRSLYEFMYGENLSFTNIIA